jgi:predicted PurR-regulated permease PerM
MTIADGTVKLMTELLRALRRHRLGLFVMAVGVLVAWLLWSARGALPAFFIALALAFLLDPIVTFLRRQGVPRWAGILLCYAFLLAFGWALIAFAVPPIARQARDLITHLPELGAALSNIQNDLLQWYRSLPLPTELRAMLDESIRNAESAFGEAVRSILGPAVSTVLRAAGFILGLIVIPIWLFFVLKDRERFPQAVTGALPEHWRVDGSNVLTILARVGGRWVRGQLLLGAAIFAATVIGLTILTFAGFREFGEFTLVLALIAGVLEWFPIVGPILAAIPAVLIGLSISPAATIAAIVLYVGIQQLENNLLVPKVLGDAVDLHPAVLIVALVVGGALFGIGGAILAAPTLAAGRDLYRYTFQRLHDQPPPTALQMALHGSNPHPEPEPSPQLSPATAEPGPPAASEVPGE